MKEKFPHITKVLIALAERMCDNPEQYTVEDGKNLDRALRTCPDIYDIHTEAVRSKLGSWLPSLWRTLFWHW